MLNGLKDMFKPDDDRDNKPPKMPNKTFITIILGIIGLIGLHFGYSFISGSDSEKQQMTEYIQKYFHISPIDVGICAVLLVIYIILKIKHKNDD
ncbi:MAG: hypothetical protein IK999_13110 [Ruminococcus sp.]|nr:hypothetical protein [Ruminococcus sp.]